MSPLDINELRKFSGMHHSGLRLFFKEEILLRDTKKNDAEKIMSQNSAPTISQTLNFLYSEGAMFYV